MSIGSTVGISSIRVYIYYIRMNTYSETIDEIQKIEEVIIKDSKLNRCCNSSVEIVKTFLKYLKN